MSAVAHLLNRTLEHWRPSEEPGEAGGTITTWTQVGDAECRVSQPSASERAAAMLTHAELAHPVYTDPGADVRRGDELRDPDTGETWQVRAVYQPSQPGTYLRADTRLHQTGPPEGDES